MFSFFKKKNEKKYMWSCDSCSTPIAIGDDRFHCLDCANFDLCPKCHKKGVHNTHEFVFEKEQVAMLRELVVRFNLLLTHKKGDIANETIGNMFVTYSDRKCLATYQNGVYVYSTYEQIHNRILNFAAGLVKLQMIPNIKHLTSSALDTRTYVVICGKNSLEWFLTDYACVIKSLVSVTIHYTTSKEDIEHIMSAMKVSVVVCTSDLVPMFNAICANHPSVRGIITMDQESMEKAIVPLHTFKQVEKTGSSHKKYRNTVALNSTQDVLTLVYTSGSTGRPKGAMIPDVTWNNQIKNPMEPYRTSMVFAPLAHVSERRNTTRSLCNGNRAAIFEKEVTEIFDHFRMVRPTALSSTPRLYNIMYEDFQRELHQYRLKNNTIIDEHCEDPDEAQNKDEERFLRDLYSKYFEMVGGNVRSVVTGGASTSVAVLRFLNHVFEWPCGVYDGYGATETGAIMINNAIVSTVEFKIVDVPEMGYYQTDLPKPRGELCVKTTSMFTGYINDETQTSNAMDSDGYVHTGDIVEHLGGRNCRIIDRKKNILKLAQGEFVAPEAIENTLVESLFVSQVYVYGSTVRSFVLAVVVPNWRIVKEWNTELDIDDEKIVTNPILKAKLMEEIVLVGKRKKLAQYQIPRDVILQRQDFKHETGQLTSIGKIARFNCEKIYKEQLENLYEELEQSKRGDISNFIHGVMGQGTDAEESQIDSLHAVRIASIIKTKYNIEVDAKTILGNGTVNGITDLILKGGTSAPKKMYNWEEELALEIQVPPKTVPTSEMLHLHGDILLTGSTGFLGAFLLDTLLTTTNCRIHCIVRAGQVTPLERIKSTMEYHKRILPTDFEDRVIAYSGDLSQERLGLDEQTLSRLCETIRIIYHNGAHVNSLFTYEKLKAENVASTREIIKMATTGPLKVIHYTSTISVVRNFVTRRITEDVDENETQDQLFHRLDTMGGYAATKYVAEKLLRKARDAGVPVTIYRPGMIGHDRVTGCCNMTDWVNRFILACIHVGMYPITRARLNAVPVDQVASIIVQASQMESSLEQCYHIVNDVENELNFNLMMQFVSDLTVIEFRGWMKMVDSMLEHNQSGPIYDALWPMIGLFKHGFPEPGTPVGNDRLEKIGVTLKPLTKEDVQQQASFIIANCKINGETR